MAKAGNSPWRFPGRLRGEFREISLTENNLVSSVVPKLVIDRLEMIQIEHHDSEGLFGPRPSRDLLLGNLLEGSTVPNLGEWIDPCLSACAIQLGDHLLLSLAKPRDAKLVLRPGS